jgi:hypothetical protein
MPSVFAQPVYDASPAKDRLFVELAGANHMHFANVPDWQSWFGSFNPFELTTWFGGMTKDDQLALTQRYATAWLERFLAGSTDKLGLTDGSAARRDEDLGLVSKAFGGATAEDGLPLPGFERELQVNTYEQALKKRDRAIVEAEQGAPSIGIADRLEQGDSEHSER